MSHAYRSAACTPLERRAINLALRYDERHDALELTAECQMFLEDAGFARIWGTIDTREADAGWAGDATRKPWQYFRTQEIYYYKGDALVLLCYVSYPPFSSDSERMECAYLAPACDEVSALARFKSEQPRSILDIMNIQFHRAMVLCDIRNEIDERGICDFEKALIAAAHRA